MARRGNHEGSIRERDDGVWEVAVAFDGRRFYGRAATQAEARRKLGELRRKHAVGELVPSTRVKLADHLAAWLDTGAAEWKPKTYQEYESVCRVYLNPAMGHLKVQSLTAVHLAGWYARWRKERKVTGGTVLNVHRVLSRALTVAVRWGVVGRNVAKDVEPPRAIRHRPELWSPGDASLFLDSELELRWRALWALLVGSGCRIGEALAVRWSDIDRDAGLLSISRSVTFIKGAAVETEPKTQAGVRLVTLPVFALDTLREWRTVQLEERLAAGPAWGGGDLVVTAGGGRRPSSSMCWGAFRKTCRRAGLRQLRIHDLRHLHASMLLAEGLPIPAVSARLGHASPAVTMAVYSHALKGQDATAALAIEAALGARRVGDGR